MDNDIFFWNIVHHTELNNAERILLLAIHKLSNHQNIFLGRVSTLSSHCRLPRSTGHRVFLSLVNKGLILPSRIPQAHQIKPQLFHEHICSINETEHPTNETKPILTHLNNETDCLINETKPILTHLNNETDCLINETKPILNHLNNETDCLINETNHLKNETEFNNKDSLLLTNNSINKKKREKRKRKTPFPQTFSISDDMQRWYQSQPSFTLPIHQATDTWQDAMQAKGFNYVDWTAAWRNGMKNQNKWEAERLQRMQKPSGSDIHEKEIARIFQEDGFNRRI